MIGSPWTFRPPPSVAGAAAAAAAGGAVAVALASSARSAVRGASAAQQSPGPSTSRNGWPSTPDTYRMSEKPGGGATSDRTPGMLPAGANTMWFSGSYPTHGQFVAVTTVMAPSDPFTLPRVTGLDGASDHLERLLPSSAAARSSGVKSIRSSGIENVLRAY